MGAHGDAGLAARVDHSMALAEHWEKRVRESGGKFVMSQPRTFTNTCFWVVPEKFRPFDPATADQKTRVAIGKVAPAIKANMQKAGDAMIGYQLLNGLPNFFRIVFANCDDLTFDDLDALLGRMERIGEVVAQDISAEGSRRPGTRDAAKKNSPIQPEGGRRSASAALLPPVCSPHVAPGRGDGETIHSFIYEWFVPRLRRAFRCRSRPPSARRPQK